MNGTRIRSNSDCMMASTSETMTRMKLKMLVKTF
jgi:hypothetical protein